MDSKKAKTSNRSTVEGTSTEEIEKEMKCHQATKDVAKSAGSLKAFREDKSSEMHPEERQSESEGVGYQSESSAGSDCPPHEETSDCTEQQRVPTSQQEGDTKSFWTLAQQDNDPWIDTPLEDLDSILALPENYADDYEPVPYSTLIRGAAVAVADSTRGEKRKRSTPLITPKVLRSEVDMMVGPDSWQMKLVNKMLDFAESLNAHSLFYFDEDTSNIASGLKNIINVCTSKHLEGLTKYRNLPGAIFEDAVDTLGGPTFLKLFRAVTVEKERLKEKKIRISTTPNDDISLMDFAVGYGMHLAQELGSTDVGTQLTREEAVKEGARSVLAMNNEARVSFWKTKIRSEESTLS